MANPSPFRGPRQRAQFTAIYDSTMRTWPVAFEEWDVETATPVTVLIGERDVIYRGGPQAALARAQRLIPIVRTDILPGANHIMTLDCPDALITPILAALA